MSLIVVLSVMNGFRADLMSKILGVNAHVLTRNYRGSFENYQKIQKDIRTIDGVVETTPAIYSQIMLNNSGISAGAVLRGIDTKSAHKVIEIKQMIKNGHLDSLDKLQEGFPAIILGTELAKQLGAFPGDILTVISPEGKLTPMGRVPNSRKFMVKALFNSGMYEYDLTLAFISLKEAQDFLGLDGRISGIEIRVDLADKANLIGEDIQKKLRYPFWTQDWKSRNRSLFAALNLEKRVMFIILTMIVLVGALNIISTLVMVVMEKARDVAILRAMGATKSSIMFIFMLQGLIVGVIGTLAGTISGLGLCHLIEKYIHIKLDPGVYYIPTLPVMVELTDVIIITISAILISFFSTIYPSWRASKINSVEALRYE